MSDLPERIASLLGHFEQMELRVQDSEHLTPLEALYARQMVDYRQEQLVLLSDALHSPGPQAKLKVSLAARLGTVASQYTRKLEDKR